MVAGRPTLSDEEFELVNGLLTQRFGLHFSEAKKEILEARLRPRLEAHRLTRFMDYYLLLLYGLNGSRADELKQLVSAITNNESYFFRETHQFESLFDGGVDDLRSSSPIPRGLRFMSAGCSTGEEPYTLNAYVRDNQYQLGSFPVSIDAYDLDQEAVKKAVAAEYGKRSLRSLETDQVSRYFTDLGDERYLLRPVYRSGVRFSTGNLVERSLISVPGVYDVIFCRNVLIYFTDESQSRVIDNFAYWLRRGGLLFLGHSESIIGRTDKFEAIRMSRCVAYRRL